jgi:DNA-binding transcriptional regulator YiaG
MLLRAAQVTEKSCTTDAIAASAYAFGSRFVRIVSAYRKSAILAVVMAAPPPLPSSSSHEALYAADIARVSAVLGLDTSALADALHTSVADVATWLEAGGPVPARWSARAHALAAEARRTTQLYLSPDVRRLRSVARLTQLEFASAIGVDRATVVQWELGHRLPKGRRIESLRDFERLLLERPPNPSVRDCPRCGNAYPRTSRYYHRNDTAPDGLHSVCRGCRTGTGETYWLRRYGTIF